MKKLELSDEAFAALARLAAAKQLTPAELVAALVGRERPPLAGDHLLFFLTGDAFAQLAHPVDRYLALLGWCAQHDATDFADFIAHQDSARHYLAWQSDEINAARARNHARQIAGTPFWAVLTIDEATRRRFVCRLLEFIGCHDETIALACQALGFAPATGFRLLSA